MRFNGVLAAPGFEQWFDGEPLDPAHLLHTADGRRGSSMFSIAHLGDAERMFFVSLLFNQMLAWMRGLTGTSSLRTLLYMDEIAGFFPPVANPPSKLPLLTLLKQGRAFGLGVVLATQNPVDLDYKGLSNIGTWFLGRLQTERDKARVLDGLEGAAAGASIARRRIGSCRHSASACSCCTTCTMTAPRIFQTRWTMSYLRGPLSRDQIRTLMADRRPRPSTSPSPRQVTAKAPPASVSASTAPAGGPPVLPPGIQQVFLPRATAGQSPVYSPVVLGAARVAFSDATLGVEFSRDVVYSATVTDGPVPLDWSGATPIEFRSQALPTHPNPARRSSPSRQPRRSQGTIRCGRRRWRRRWPRRNASRCSAIVNRG